MNRRTIRGRLTVSYLSLVTVCLVVVALFVTWRLQQQYMLTYRSVILTQARLIGRMLQEYGKDGPAAAQTDRLSRVAKEFRWREDATIDVLPVDRILELGQSAPPELVAATKGEPSQFVRADSAGRQRVFAAAPVVVRDQTIAVVHISVPTGWVWSQLRRILPWLGVALLIGVLAAWLIGGRLARQLVEPIDDLTRVAAEMSAGGLNTAVRPRGPDEIGRLGEMFNRMADRLRTTITTLSAEQTKLAAVMTGMMDGVIATDRAGKVTLANRAAIELLGWPPDPPEPRGAAWKVGPRLRAVLEDAATLGKVTAEELPPAEASDRLIEVHCAPIQGEGGRPTGAVAVLRDVTDVRRLERARRELTANVSHELRTPLTSIKGFAETLLAGAMNDEKTSRHFLQIIDQETNRLVKLVDDLLDLSRLEGKGLSLELAQVRVGEIVKDAVTKMTPLAGTRHVQVRSARDVTVLADRDRLAQVLTNLLDNAIKFTPNDGRIAVAWRAANGEVEVSVADTGPGIAASDLPHIFDRFYKADRARAAIPGGSGLGLAITKHIIEAHGGRIRVASAPGVGTTFTFTLPRDGD
jgi:two-component system, OmpR family, phosphate regulon sensor histidine kinase PhoR